MLGGPVVLLGRLCLGHNATDCLLLLLLDAGPTVDVDVGVFVWLPQVQSVTWVESNARGQRHGACRQNRKGIQNESTCTLRIRPHFLPYSTVLAYLLWACCRLGSAGLHLQDPDDVGRSWWSRTIGTPRSMSQIDAFDPKFHLDSANTIVFLLATGCLE